MDESAPGRESETTAVSASGKVLLTGGYLVLDPKYAGLVVSTSSRFYTVVRPGNDVVGGKEDERTGSIRVRSPQFESAEWVYGVEIDDGGVVRVTQPDGYVCYFKPLGFSYSQTYDRYTR